MNKNLHIVSPELWTEMLKSGWKKQTILERAIATEILEELPGNIKKTHCLIITKMSRQWKVSYHGKIVRLDKYLPNALAKMRFYLKKEKLL